MKRATLKEREKKSDELLVELGITRDDFYRFRTAYRVFGSRDICVETREFDGCEGSSAAALRKAGKHLVNFEPDEDRTYCYFYFRLGQDPKSSEKRGQA